MYTYGKVVLMALICLLRTSMKADKEDEEMRKARNDYLKSTIKVLEEYMEEVGLNE